VAYFLKSDLIPLSTTLRRVHRSVAHRLRFDSRKYDTCVLLVTMLFLACWQDLSNSCGTLSPHAALFVALCSRFTTC
jgi:hypothetical protein